MTSRILRHLSAVCLLTALISWPAASWAPGSGFQTSLTQSEWQSLQGEFRACNINRAPYHRTFQSIDYDHVVWVLTPFARVAHYVRESKRLHQTTSYEEAARIFDPSVFIIKLKTQTFTHDKSLSVRVVLKSGATTIQPLHNELTRDTLTKVGYYGKQYYIVERNFSFDMAQVSKCSSLSAVILEADEDAREIPLDLPKLR